MQVGRVSASTVLIEASTQLSKNLERDVDSREVRSSFRIPAG